LAPELATSPFICANGPIVTVVFALSVRFRSLGRGGLMTACSSRRSETNPRTAANGQGCQREQAGAKGCKMNVSSQGILRTSCGRSLGTKTARITQSQAPTQSRCRFDTTYIQLIDKSTCISVRSQNYMLLQMATRTRVRGRITGAPSDAGSCRADAPCPTCDRRRGHRDPTDDAWGRSPPRPDLRRSPSSSEANLWLGDTVRRVHTAPMSRVP